MAIRSLLLSLTITGLLGYSLTVGLTDPNTFLKKLPEWTAYPFIVGCFLLYLLAGWWAIKGFSAHKISAVLSLVLCTCGLGLYVLGFLMEVGHGKATPGQYDYDFARLDPAEKASLTQLVQEAGLRMQDANFTEHWNIMNTGLTFRVCVQKGHVTALNLSDHPVRDLRPLSQLPQLSDLYLRNCQLSDMSSLHSTRLERLDISDNQLTDLQTLRGCPNIQWLFAANNQLRSTDGLKQFKEVVASDFTGNPLPK
jgi:Leucine-rich repeat (LRR) protein